MISGKLGRGEVLAIEIPVTLPKDSNILNKVAYNTYGIKFELNNPFFESNSVGFTTTKYLLEGNLFEDVNLNNLLDDEDKLIAGHKVELVYANGDTVNDFAGNPIAATTDANGHYEIDVYTSGDYKVKVIPPVGFKAIESNDGDNGSHIVSDNMTDVFTIDINNDHIIKNAGYVEVPEPDATTIDIKAKKELEGRALRADEFTFELKDSTGTIIQTKKNDANGKVKIEALNNIGAGKYKYTIEEVKGTDNKIVYDENIYNIEVEVTLNQTSNKLEPSIKYTDENGNKVSEVVFKNIYTKPVTPIDPIVPIDPELPVEPSEPVEPSTPVEPDVLPELNKKDHYGYMVGYEGGNFKPNANVTRAEAVTIFFRMLTEDSRNNYWSASNNFKDVKNTAWYNNAVSTLANAKVIEADANGNFRPNEAMTRAEFAVLLSKFFNEEGIKTHKFTDIKGHSAEKEIAKVAAKGWIEGYPDNTFRPDALITRAETVKLVNKILDRKVDINKLLPNMIEFKDNQDKNKWYYGEIQEATNSHQYTIKDSKSLEVWTKLLPVRDWVALEKEWSKSNSSTNPGNIK